MDAEQLARWIRDDCLADTGTRHGHILTVADKADFEIETADGTQATVTVELRS